MPPLERKGHLIVHAFEKGRILVQEPVKPTGRDGSRLFLMERPANQEEEVKASGSGLLQRKLSSFGWMLVRKDDERNNGYFEISVKQAERSRGYGTVLMNAGARYARDIGLDNLNGLMMFDENIQKRIKFFEELEMWHDRNEYYIFASVNAPKLNQITFERNLTAEEVLNSKK